MSTRYCTVISDTHNYHHNLKLPGGDVLLHCGDFSTMGTLKEVLDFLLWFSRQKYSYKIFIAGNHDLSLDAKKNAKKGKDKILDLELKELILKTSERLGLIYLENSRVQRSGLYIYGSPYSPSFNNWAFQLDNVEKERKMFSQIPKNLDILLTHAPPYSVLDAGGQYYQQLGSVGLQEYVFKRKPRVHCFGHIHESHGIQIINDIKFINASYCSMPYNVFNNYIDFELEVS